MCFRCPECFSLDVDFVAQCGLVTDYICSNCQYTFTDEETEEEQEEKIDQEGR